MIKRETKSEVPVRITTAPLSRSDDIAARQRRYLISMGIRSVCFVAAVVVGEGWLRWVLVAASFFLPTVAVVVANSATPRVEGTALRGVVGEHPELEARR